MHLIAITVLTVLCIERSCARGHFSRQHVDTNATTLPKAKCPECEPVNDNLVCVENQEKQIFYKQIGENCKCPQYRCMWTTCPKKENVTCKECERQVEIEDCGCTIIKCEEKKLHCETPKVECGPCEQLEQKMDCGCPKYFCAKPVTPSASECNCTACEECVDVEIGTPGCGQMRKECKPKQCPESEKSKCDLECETPEIVKEECCSTLRCHPKNEPAECDEECYEPMTTFSEKCGFEKSECARRACHQPAKDKFQCYKTDSEDKCGCPEYTKEPCKPEPVSDCPEGQTPEAGVDGCGCVTRICVLCSQVFPEPECPKGEIVVNIDPDTQCEKKTCEPIVECPKPPTCQECEELQTVGTFKDCPIEACVKSTEPACICKHVESCPDECEVPGKQTRGLCVGYKTCVAKPAYECPTPNNTCDECQDATLVEGKCGCKEYKCEKKICKALTAEEEEAKDKEEEQAKTRMCDRRKGERFVMGKDKCGCPAPTCITRPTPYCKKWGFRFNNGTEYIPGGL